MYAIGDNPYGPFTYQGVVLEPVLGWTNHHSIIEFNGKWYLFYHDSSLSGGQTHLRSVKVAELHYNPDGTIDANALVDLNSGDVADFAVTLLLDELDQTLLGIRGVAATRMGEVTIACVPSVAHNFLPPILQRFYTELPGLVDTLIEGYQGKYGLVNDYPTTVTMPESDNGVKLLESLTLFIASNRAKLATDSEIQNQIDEIQSLINSTLYKLKFLS
jgi:hypothetical protein